MNPFWLDGIMSQVNQDVRKAARDAGQLTIKECIEALNALPDLPVISDIGAVSDAVGSYRGYYEHLSILPADKDYPNHGATTARKLEGALRDAIGREQTGYKGGEYTMDKDSLVWLSEYGTASGLRITGFQLVGDNVVMATEQEKWP